MSMRERRRELRCALRSGHLTPRSEVSELRYIGPYLERRLRHALGEPLTLARLAAQTRNLKTDALRRCLQRILQNERKYQRVAASSTDPRRTYVVPRVNRCGWNTVIAIMKIFDRGQDGYGLAPRGYRANLHSFSYSHGASRRRSHRSRS